MKKKGSSRIGIQGNIQPKLNISCIPHENISIRKIIIIMFRLVLAGYSFKFVLILILCLNFFKFTRLFCSNIAIGTPKYTNTEIFYFSR